MNDDETIQQQIEVLKAEHRQLDERISAMAADGACDQLELARLKKRKLWLRDQIQLLVDRSIPDIIA